MIAEDLTLGRRPPAHERDSPSPTHAAARMGSLDPSDAMAHARKMAALGELASGITHDFRNILQTVISTLELIETRRENPAEVRRLAESALRAADRGIGLTRRLLTFSRRGEADVKPVDVAPAIESVVDTLSRTLEASMKVSMEPSANAVWASAVDLTELELVLINLGINARDSMPGGGHIRLSARNINIPHVSRRRAESRSAVTIGQIERRGTPLPLPAGDYIAIWVVDTGTGMDKATLARATEPFFTTKADGKGTGLGLAMASGFAVQRGGALRLMSELGIGTKVELWLPRHL
jgi:signal transduction histidine kinase